MNRPSKWQRRRLWALEFVIITGFGLLYSAFFLSASETGTGLRLSGLNPDVRIIALELERLAGLLIPIEIGLGFDERIPGIGHLPTWNPYMGTGTPLINNAFLYLFNPFMSLPVLFLGAIQGTKIALIISLILAGFNMWALGKAIGLGAVARVTVAALYMMSGGIMGKFFNGHFQLGLSLAWPPLVLAGLWWTLSTRSRLAPALTAIAFALLFFSGNIYYTLHTLICCAVIVTVHIVQRRNRFDWLALRRVILAGAFALGLAAVQFIPVWSVRDYVSHETADFNPDTGQLIGQHDMGLSVANFVTPWESWKLFQNPPINMWGAVNYAYIGPAVFALIIGLVVLALFRVRLRHRRAIAIALFLAILMMIWGAAQTSIVQELYRRVALLSEFRFLGRANSIAGLWWIVLAGIALDNLWHSAREALNTPADSDRRDQRRLLWVLVVAAALWGVLLLTIWRVETYSAVMETLVNLVALALILDTLWLFIRHVWKPPAGVPFKRALATRAVRVGLLLFALAAISDVMHVNSKVIHMEVPDTNFGRLYGVAHTVDRDTDPFPSIQEPFSPSTFDSYYSQVRNWGLNEGWIPQPVEGDIIPENRSKLLNLPGWAIASTRFAHNGSYTLSQGFVQAHDGILRDCVFESTFTTGSDSCESANRTGSGLYELPAALPYAFIVPENVLTTQARSITVENTQPVPVDSHQMDTITIRVTTPEDTPGVRDFLIVQETHFPGWQAYVDGERTYTVTAGNQAPRGVSSGFIGVPLRHGTHTYTLRFEPPGFKAGIIVSVLTAVVMVLYLVGVPLLKHTPAPEPETRLPVLSNDAAPLLKPVPAKPPRRRWPRLVVGLATLTGLLIAGRRWLNQKKAADDSLL